MSRITQTLRRVWRFAAPVLASGLLSAVCWLAWTALPPAPSTLARMLYKHTLGRLRYVRWWTLAELGARFTGYKMGRPTPLRDNAMIAVHAPQTPR